MDVLNLIKATIILGVVAFLCYSYPVIGQAMVIGVLALLWLGYVHATVMRLLRR
jgi:hypothetical protein